MGLKIHMGMTEILSTKGNQRGLLAQQKVDGLGEEVEVLPVTEGTVYLGRLLNFSDFHDAEIRMRINKGWAAFNKFQQELCCKQYPIQQRLKLFDAMVSATVLYGIIVDARL